MPLPRIKSGSGTVVGMYRLGTYTCMLARDPEVEGPIRYFYMLSVLEAGAKSPTLVVTLEQNKLQKELLRMVEDQLDAETKKSLSSSVPDVFVCNFDKDGTHHIIQKTEGVLSAEKFLAEAFLIVKDRLKVTGEPVAINRGNSSIELAARVKRWPIVLIAMAILLVILFPPFNEHFLVDRSGAQISGHGGWKFLFSIGKNNSHFSTESINIVLWLAEICIVTVVSTVGWRFISKK